MSHKILIPETVAGEGLDFLRQKGYEVKMGRGRDKHVLIEDLRDCDAVIIRVAVIDEEVFSGCPGLKVVAKHGVGVDSIDTQAARRHGCRVVYAPLANTLSVAEQTIALIFACAKKLPLKMREYARGNYTIKDTALSTEVSGKTLGLIGAGRIAREVAHIARNGLGMRVLACDPFLPDGFASDVLELASRETVLRQADFLSIHIPATDDTTKSFGEKEFALMKPAACFINTARGKIVDEDALVRALRDGVIGGAGLDVSDPEPAPPESPLFSLDNVVMSPHCAGVTREAMVRMVMDAAMGIDEVFSGREPTYPVV
ncbi:MAG: hydroxyacid dehydrogenase [Spirochaetales bacterium]|jgi:D-3-phosphoglycerate dehydrogenase|nr:hydroxyacid dehydrogenase [Spirochaetales bacterium]